MEIAVETTDSEDKTPTPKVGETGSHNGLRLPTSTQPDRSWYYGAYVFDPVPGKHHNVVYPDHSSMYPNMIRNLNVSPETLVGTQDELDDSEWTEDDCVWGYIDTRDVKKCENHEDWNQYCDPEQYKAVRQRDSNGNYEKKWADDPNYDRLYFLKPSIKKGFITSVVDDMMGLKNQYNGTPKYEAIKRVVNSTYGVLGFATEYNAFRLFDWRMAECITLTGRLLIQYTAAEFSHYLREEKGVDAKIVAGDTDSCVCSMEDVGLKSQCLEYAFDAAEHFNDIVDDWMKAMCNVDDHYVELEIESYSPTAYFHHMKKRYFTHVTWDDDDGDDADELNVKGFEMVRSDVADITVEVQEYIRDQILYEDNGTAKANIYQYLRDVVSEIEDGERSLEELGVRSGFGKGLENYGGPNRRPRPIVRGAKYARENLEGCEDLDETSKPMVFPIDRILDDDLPRTYDAETAEDGDVVDAIAVEDPSVLEGKVVIDREEIIEKQVRDRVSDILENVGMSYEDAMHKHEATALEDFM